MHQAYSIVWKAIMKFKTCTDIKQSKYLLAVWLMRLEIIKWMKVSYSLNNIFLRSVLLLKVYSLNTLLFKIKCNGSFLLRLIFFPFRYGFLKEVMVKYKVSIYIFIRAFAIENIYLEQTLYIFWINIYKRKLMLWI